MCLQRQISPQVTWGSKLRISRWPLFASNQITCWSLLALLSSTTCHTEDKLFFWKVSFSPQTSGSHLRDWVAPQFSYQSGELHLESSGLFLSPGHCQSHPKYSLTFELQTGKYYAHILSPPRSSRLVHQICLPSPQIMTLHIKEYGEGKTVRFQKVLLYLSIRQQMIATLLLLSSYEKSAQ